MLKLGYTTLYVSNVTETIIFYEKAFGFTRRMIHESGDYGELDTGDTTLSFSAFGLIKDLGHSPSRAAEHGPVFEIALIADDIDTAVATAIAAGAVLISEPDNKPWGQWVAYVKDLNGFLIEICTKVEKP